MSYSALVTGWTERRLPFCVTIIFSSPRVALRLASGIVAAKRSTKPISTEYQIGAAGVEAGSKYPCPCLQADGPGRPARRLRARLGTDYEVLIGTVPNVGYRFVPEVADSFSGPDA